MPRALALAALFGFAFTSAAADNWPSWRGPSANGIAPAGANPPTKWDEKTNIKWKAELTGRGSATPAIWGDKVFVLTAVKTDREATPAEMPKADPRFDRKTVPPKNFYRFDILCFDRTTGKPLWKKTAN